MKNIVFLEHKPEILEPSIQYIREQFSEKALVHTLLFYCENVERDNSKRVEEIQKNLLIENIVCVDLWDLELKLDELYQNEDNIFIFDTQLDQKNWEDFDYMLSVNYALSKKNDGRIWFYTTAGSYFKDNIIERFPKHTLELLIQEEGGILLDLVGNAEFIKKIGV